MKSLESITHLTLYLVGCRNSLLRVRGTVVLFRQISSKVAKMFHVFHFPTRRCFSIFRIIPFMAPLGSDQALSEASSVSTSSARGEKREAAATKAIVIRAREIETSFGAGNVRFNLPNPHLLIETAAKGDPALISHSGEGREGEIPT